MVQASQVGCHRLVRDWGKTPEERGFHLVLGLSMIESEGENHAGRRGGTARESVQTKVSESGRPLPLTLPSVVRRNVAI